MNENDRRFKDGRIIRKWEESGLLDGLPIGGRENHAKLLEEQLYQDFKKALDERFRDVELKLFGELDTPKKYLQRIDEFEPVSFKTLKFPIYRRAFTNLWANELVSVQPMSISSGLLFYMDYKLLCEDEDFYVPIREPPAVIADPSKYPHRCPRCDAPAYIGFTSVDCSRKSCS